MLGTQLKVLYCDEHLVVINKAHDLLSVPAKNTALSNAATQLQHLFARPVHVVHRLDMSTSGLMVFAFNKPTLVALQQQFSQRLVHKVYESLVFANPSGKSGVINAPLCVDWANRPKQKVDYIQGKPALTRWQKLSSSGNFSRLELHPYTGRSHQLRVHLMHIGHAILGDELYAKSAQQQGRLMLHAKALGFIHPKSQSTLLFSCAAPF